MGRCGCASGCGCRHQGRNGVITSGTGSVDSPIIVELANPMDTIGCNVIMDCVGSHLGAGMRYDPVTHRVAARLSTDGGNTLEFGTDNGLFTGGAGGAGGFATVQSLVDATEPVVGSVYGAGYTQYPEGRLESYEQAMAIELPLIQVPVRRSADRRLWAVHYRNLGFYNWRYAGLITDGFDQKMGRHVWLTPGGEPTINPATSEKGFTALAGYMGYGTQDSYGLATVADVARVVQRRAVLLLDVLDIGLGPADTPAPSLTYSALRTLIRRMGLTASAIVCSEWPLSATPAERAEIRAGLLALLSDGVAIGLRIMTAATAAAMTPAAMVADGYTWVIVHYALADTNPATVKAYKDAGLHVLLTPGHRQWQYELMRDATTFGPGGLKGILCSDPLYCAGEQFAHVVRRPFVDWFWGTPDYGRHAAWSDDIPGAHARYRGYTNSGEGGTLSLDGNILLPGDDPSYRTTGYYLLAGELNPIAWPQYDLEVGFVWQALTTDRTRWIAVWFGSPNDRDLREWTLATTHTKGYNLQLTQTGQFVLERYDGVVGADPPYQSVLVWESGWGTVTPGVQYRIKIRVRGDRIIVGPASETSSGPGTRALMDTTWRGPYLYFGRHFFHNADSVRIRWVQPVITEVP